MDIVGDKLYIAEFEGDVCYLVYADPGLQDLLHSLARMEEGVGATAILGHYIFPAVNKHDGVMYDVFTDEQFELKEAVDEEIKKFITAWNNDISVALHNWLADLQNESIIQLPKTHCERIVRLVEKCAKTAS